MASRVDTQIHQDLIDLYRVGADDSDVVATNDFEGDVLANHAVQHFQHVRDRVVQVHVFHLKHLPTAERQELATNVVARSPPSSFPR